MAHLVSNDSSAVRHELTKAEYVLGRHPDCDIVVDAGAVSRQHARLSREGAKFFVEDMQSRNGTYVNGRMVYGRYGLSEGDQIRVCDVSFTFHGEPSAEVESSQNLTVLVDDTNGPANSTVWSKLDVTSEDSHLTFTASPEAKLEALLEITRSLGRSLSLDQVLPQVLNSLFKVFSSSRPWLDHFEGRSRKSNSSLDQGKTRVFWRDDSHQQDNRQRSDDFKGRRFFPRMRPAMNDSI